MSNHAKGQTAAAATIPYELTRRYGGAGIYYGLVAPTHFREHAHPDIQIIPHFLNTDCLANWQTDGGRRIVRPIRQGHTSIIPSGQPHGADWNREASVLSITLEPDFLARIATDLYRSVTTRCLEITEAHQAEDVLLQQLSLSLQAEMQQESPPERLLIESVANIFAIHLLRDYSAEKRPQPVVAGALPPAKLRQATQYVQENLDQDLSLAEVSAALGLSSYHFSRLFKQSTGLTPRQYVITRRVEQAQMLLRAGRLSIGEIALAVGFANQSHLTLHFKRLVGMTPRRFREG